MRAENLRRLWTLARRASLAAAVLLGGVAAAQAQAQPPANALPAGNGKDLVAVACTQCHGLRLIVALRDGPVGWRHFVDDMILRGAQLNSQEADTVSEYLAKSFGPGTSPMQSGLKSEALPAGEGQNLVQSHCTLCHDLGRITTVQRSKQEWNGTVTNMMARAGTNAATPGEITSMASYLAANFGSKAN
jgi:cytochrome c5